MSEATRTALSTTRALCREWADPQSDRYVQERFTACYAGTNPSFVIQNIPSSRIADKKLWSVYCIVDNILCRGSVTPLTPYLASQYFSQLVNDDGLLDYSIYESRDFCFFEPVYTFSRELPIWHHTIKGGDGLDNNPARKLFERILPSYLDQDKKVLQFFRPEVRIDEIIPNDTELMDEQVDFYFDVGKLVIEVDGAQHTRQATEDRLRDSYLWSKAGVTTIRVPASIVVANDTRLIPYLEQIKKAIESSNWKEIYYSSLKYVAESREEYAARKALDIIMRYELALLCLLKHGRLDIRSSQWNISLARSEHSELLHSAYEDLKNWFKPIMSLAGYDTTFPTLLIETNAPLCIDLDYNSFWTDAAETNRNTVYIRNDYFVTADYYEVQTGDCITYDIDGLGNARVQENLELLLSYLFGYHGYRSGQISIIEKALSRTPTIGILPTGAGKSLCYQVVSILQPVIVLVVAPLISLIADQKRNLDCFGFDRTSYVASTQDGAEKSREIARFGEGRYQILWISPERFQNEQFRSNLTSISHKKTVSYAVLDEVHCLSEWGHDFRTSYLVLCDTIRNCCPDAILVGLTATASQFVLDDIQREFQIDASGVAATYNMTRPELHFHIIEAAPNNHSGKLIEIIHELDDKYNTNVLQPNGEDSICGLVFTVTAKGKWIYPGCERLSEELQTALAREGYIKACYHGQLDKDRGKGTKETVQNAFIRNETPLLITTKAFGMGINKKNVRYTIHYTMPWSCESFYQEAGRAGRDGDKAKAQSDCYIIYSKENIGREQLERLFASDTPVEEAQEIAKQFTADLNPIFFLWGMNNRGIDAELSVMRRIIGELINGATIIRPSPDESKDLFEKALYHLGILGIHKGWLVNNWNTGAVEILGIIDFNSPNLQATVESSLLSYIHRYDKNFSLRGTDAHYSTYRDIMKNGTELFECYVRVLLKWVEANIVYNRKQSIQNILNDIEQYRNDGDAFKEHIEARFRITQVSSLIDEVARDARDINLWFEIIDNRDTDTAIANLQRYVESYQNNHGLNYCLAVCQLLANQSSAFGLDDRLSSALDSLSPRLRKQAIEKAIIAIKERDAGAQSRNTFGRIVSRRFPELSRSIYKELGDEGSLAIILNDQLQRLNRIGGNL